MNNAPGMDWLTDDDPVYDNPIRPVLEIHAPFTCHSHAAWRRAEELPRSHAMAVVHDSTPEFLWTHHPGRC